MSCKGFKYAHELTSRYPMEYEAVVFAYTQAGWKEIASTPDAGFPKAIIFEWQNDGPPLYPKVNWP